MEVVVLDNKNRLRFVVIPVLHFDSATLTCIRIGKRIWVAPLGFGVSGQITAGVYFLCMTYEQQLEDIRWKEKRHQIILRDLEMCQVCMSSKFLQVHHKVYYTDGRMAWEYPDITMTTLCRACHESFHLNYKVPVTKPDRLLDLFQNLKNSFGSLRGLIQSTGDKYG